MTKPCNFPGRRNKRRYEALERERKLEEALLRIYTGVEVLGMDAADAEQCIRDHTTNLMKIVVHALAGRPCDWPYPPHEVVRALLSQTDEGERMEGET